MRLQPIIVTPANAGCTCASWKPGSSARPRRSTTWVPGPIRSLKSRSPVSPSRAIRPPVTATALAVLPSAAVASVIWRPEASAV